MECELKIPTIKGLNEQELTVGRPFTLKCPIELDAKTNIQALKLLQPVEQNYKLHLLKVEKTSNHEVLILMTSYQAGQHNLTHLSMSDGVLEYPLPDQKIDVVSVLDKNQKAQLNGPMGPQLILPTMMSLMLSFVIIVYFLLVLVMKWYRYRQRMKLIEKLREHDSALSPIQQYYQLLRKEQRSSRIFYHEELNHEENRRLLLELNHGFRLFLTRHYLLPVVEWKDALFLKELKKLNKKSYELDHKDLKNVLLEFEKAQKDVQMLTKTDFVALIEHSRKLCEKLVDPKRKGD